MVPVGKTNNAPPLPFCGAKVVWCLAVFVEMARYLAVVAGMTMVMASEASGFSGSWGGCASSEAVALHLVMLALPLTELWVLPYKGLEAA